MKRIFFILFVLLWFTGCGTRSSDPKKVAWGFLHAYYNNDYEGAMPYADDATRADLENTLGQMRAAGITDDEMRDAAQPVIIEVEGIIANDGYQAVCAYKLKNAPDDYNALMETLLLTKTENGWKVIF